ncbi:hypothetical protein FQR65_LT00960 [Abscondita terminalis]|nr:hypothetical protein FQR65_LT00960 [Abscondita terminalis]
MIYKQADLQFDQEKSIVISETVPTEKENLFMKTATPEEGKVTVDVVEKKVAENLEVQTAGSILDFKPENVNTFIAEIKTKQASIVSDHKEGISVIEVQPSENEKILELVKEPDTTQANLDIHTQTVAENIEVQSQTSISEFLENIPKEMTADLTQTPIEGLVQSEIRSEEREQSFVGEFHKIPIKADVSLDQENSVTTLEVQLSEKEDLLEFAQKPHESQAIVEITAQMVAEKSQIDSQDSFQQLTPDQVEGQTVTINKNTVEAIIQSEIQIQTREVPFEGEFKAETKKANLEIDEDKSLSVSEVFTNEKEVVYKDTVVPTAMAEFDISGLVVAEGKEVDVQATVSEFRLTQTETLLQDSSSPLNDFKTESKVADVDLNYDEGLSVSQITTEEKEDTFTSSKQPETSVADLNVTTHQLPLKTEVQASDATSDFTTESPNKYDVNISSVAIEGVQQSEIQVHEKEHTFISKPPEDRVQASVAIDFENTITVTEVPINEKEINLEVKPLSTTKAGLDIEGTPVAEIYQPSLSDAFTNMEKISPLSATATIKQDTFQSVLQTETDTSETERAFEGKPKPDDKVAQPTIEEVSSVDVYENVIGYKEKEYNPSESKTDQAQEILSPLEHLQQSQVETNLNVKQIKEEKPVVDVASISQDSLKGLILSQEMIHEREQEFKDNLNVITQEASENFETSVSLDIIATTINEKETDIPEVITIEEKRAESTMLPLESVEGREIHVQNTTKKLPEERTFTETANVTQLSVEGIVIDELTVQEKEDVLENSKTFSKNAELSYTPIEHVSVTKTVPHEKESGLEKELSPHEAKANVDISTLDIAETTDIAEEYNISPIKIDKKNQEKASENYDFLETVNVTLLISGDKEDTLNIDSTEKLEKATIDLTSAEDSVIVSEINLGSKEGTLIEEPPTSKTATVNVLENTSTEQTQINILDENETTHHEPVHESQKARIDIVLNEEIKVTEFTPIELESESLISGIAKTEIAEKETAKVYAPQNEEVTSMQATGLYVPEKIRSTTAKPSISSENFGIIITEQTSTGDLESVPIDKDKPTTKQGRLNVEDNIRSLLVTEVVPQISTGQLVDTEPHKTRARVTQTTTQTNVTEQIIPDLRKDTNTTLEQDTEEICEIITKFQSSPGTRENTKVVTKRTIIKKKNKDRSDDGATVIEEILDESTPRAPSPTKPEFTIEEIIDESETSVNKGIDRPIVELPEDSTDVITLKDAVVQKVTETKAPSVKELPEEEEVTQNYREEEVTQVVTADGKRTKRIIKRRKIIKKQDGKEQTTDIITVEDEGKPAETTVTVKEVDVPEVEEEKPKRPVIEELPEEEEVTQVVTADGKRTKRIIKRRKIIKKQDGKEQTTDIVTVEDEGKPAETTVTVKEIEVPELKEEKPKKPVIEELPEEEEVTQVVTADGKRTKRIIKRRKIIKKQDGKEQTTDIVTVEDEGKPAETTVTVKEIEVPELKEEKPKKPVIEELPEEEEVTQVVTADGKRTKRIIKRRKIIKKQDGKEQTTDIVTVEDEGKPAETTVTVKEIEVPELKEEKPKKPVIEELPEEEEVTQVVTADGKRTKRIIKRRKIIKKQDGKEQTTDIVTVEDEGKPAETTVTKPVIEELPEEEEVTQVVTADGKRTKRIIKRRKIIKKQDGKEQTTDIVTVEDEGKPAETTVTVKEIEVPELKEEKRKKPVIEELPEEEEVTQVVTADGKRTKRIIKRRKIIKKQDGKEQTTDIVTVEDEELKEENQETSNRRITEEEEVTQVVTADGKRTKRIIKRRKIIKKQDGKEQTTDIVTVEDEGKPAETTVTVKEVEVPGLEEKKPKKPTIEELPEEEEVTQVVSADGKRTKRIIKRRKIIKKQDGKEQTTDIVTVEDEGKPAETTVTVKEVEVPKLEEEKPKKLLIEELPEEEEVTQVVTADGKRTKRIIKRRKIIKKQDGKEQTTDIVTVEDEGKPAETTVTVKEVELPEVEEEKPKKPVIEELPEEEEVTQVVTADGKRTKRIIKRRKIIKKQDGKEQTTDIVTVEDEGKPAETTVTVKEVDVPEAEEEKPKKPVIEELPEEEEVTQVVTADGKRTKRIIKRRKIIKKQDGKEQTTDIVTVEDEVEDEGKPAETTVTVKEVEVPELEEERPKKPLIEELPEEEEVTQVVTADGKRTKRTIKRRQIIKKQDGKVETTNIVTVEDEGKPAETTVTVKEVEVPHKTPKTIKRKIQPKKIRGKSLEELPQIDESYVVTTYDGKRKKCNKQTRTILRPEGDKLKAIKIVTTCIEGEQASVTVSEEEVQDKEKYKLPTSVIKELPVIIDVKEVTDINGTLVKRTIKRSRFVKEKDGAIQTTEIVTLQDEGEPPTTRVIVQEAVPQNINFELQPEHIVDEQESVVVTEFVNDYGKTNYVKVTKRRLRKWNGRKYEIIEIATEEVEGKSPKTTLTEYESDEINNKENPKYYLRELPEQQQIEIDTSRKTPIKKIKKTRKFVKQVGSNIETTIITTTVSDGTTPFVSILVETTDADGRILPPIKKQKIFKIPLVKELPEVTEVAEILSDDGKHRKRTKKTRKIIKEEDGILKTTQIVTIQDDNNKPDVTITEQEINLPQTVEEAVPLEEIPEEVEIQEVISADGKPKKRIKKVRKIIKEDHGKVQTTAIITTEDEGEAPQTTVTIEETKTTEESTRKKHLKKPKEYILEELPETTDVTEVLSKEGKRKTRITKTRKLIKQKDGVLQATQIVTTQDDKEEPQTTVTIQEISLQEVAEEAVPVEEIPEVMEVTEVVAEDGKPKKRVKKVRKIVKKDDDKVQTTEIVTVEDEGRAPETTVVIEETDIKTIKKKKRVPKPKETVVEELPEVVEITEVISEDGTPKKRTKKTRKILKEEQGVLHTTEIVTIQDDKEQPKVTVVDKEIVLPQTVEEAQIVEEIPEVVEITEVLSKDGKSKRRMKKIRKIVKEGDDKIQTTTIVTVEDEGEVPKTTVTIEETDVTEETRKRKHIRKPKEQVVEELPEVTETVEVTSKDGKSTKKTKKTRKIVKEQDGVVQATTIITEQNEKEAPQITVTVEDIPRPKIVKDSIQVQEMPEIVETTEITAKDGQPKKRTKKIRKIVKTDKDKVITTDIVTVQEEGEMPQTTIYVEESKPKEKIKKEVQKEPTEKEPIKELYVPSLEEIKDEGGVLDAVNHFEDGTPKKRTKKTRKILKEEQGVLHTTEIVTIQDDKEQPKVTVVDKEIVLPQTVEEAQIVEEIPEVVEITEVLSKDGKSKRRMKKIRKIVKEGDDKIQTTTIVTVEDEGEVPKTTVTIEETDVTEETRKRKHIRKPKEQVVEELPEVTETVEVTSKDGKSTKKTKKTRKIVKEQDGVVQATTIITEQNEKEAPQITVTVEDIPQTTEITAKDGQPKKRTKKIRKIVKTDKDKVITTDIVTVQEEGEMPQTTIYVEESKPKEKIKKEVQKEPTQKEPIKELYVPSLEEIKDEGDVLDAVKLVILKKLTDLPAVPSVADADSREPEIKPKKKTKTKEKSTSVQELPEVVEVIDVVSEDGIPTKRTKKIRKIVKKDEGILKTTEIVTILDDINQPSVTVTELEIALPQTIPEAVSVEEIPVDVEVTEVISKDGKPKKRVKKVRKIIKEEDDKIQTTAIVTVEEEGEAPQTTVTIEEAAITGHRKKDKTTKQLKEYVIEELPEIIETTDIISEDGKPRTRTKKTRRIVKEKDGTVEATEIVTTQVDKEEPEITVTVQEVTLPTTMEAVPLEEIPEVTEVSEVTTEDGKPKKRIKKVRKLLKKDDDKLLTTEIITVEDEGQLPKTTVIVKETTPAKKKKKVIRDKKENLDEKPKEEKPESLKLKPEEATIIKMEQNVSKPQKLKILEIKDEPINLANVKLRKPKVTEKKTVKSVQLPKFLLKSIIKHIKFPPETESEKIPIITQMKPVVRDCGVLSRNMREAEEVLKTKKRKLKVPKEIPDELEKLDLELEELKKAEKEVVDENYKYQRKPKDISKEEEQEPPQIKLGKGKIPETPETLEQVHLKKIPEKPQDTIEGKDKKPQEDEPSPRKLRKKPSEESTELEPFQPYDIERDDVDKEELEKLDIEVDDKKKPKDKDARKTKPKPKTPKQDTEQIILEKNKPKPTEEDEENEIKLRIPKSDKPEELPEKIKLKPFIKEKDATDQDTKPDTTLVLPKPIPTTEPDEDIDEVSDADRKTSKRIVKLKRKKPKDTKTEEVPETTEVINIVSEDGKPKKRIKKTRKILKEEDGVLQTTEIVTIQDENEQPQTTVLTKEVVLPRVFDKTVPVEEIPETTEVSEVVEKDGKRKKRIKKVRKIIKEDDDKLQTTSIVTIEEEGKAPETTVTVEETEVIDEVKKTRRSRKFDKPLVEELPEITEVTEIISEEGTPKKRTKKTRKIVKEDEGVVQTTEIVTVQDEQEQPQTTVTVQEIVLPKPDEERIEVEEVPEVTEVSEITSEDGKPKKRIRKIRKIVKKQDDKVQTTSIVTEEEEGKIPITTVTVEETEVTETIKKKMKRKPKEKEPIKELYVPSLEEIKDENDVLDAVKLVILKKLTGLPDVPPVSEENLQIEEAPEFKPKKKAKPKQTPKISQELPEVVEVIEIISEDGKPKKRTKKIRKIVKEEDGVLHKTEIVTIQDDKSEPNVTVTEQEITLPQTVAEAVPVEESPEVVQVTEVIAEDGKAKKRVKKVRKIIKKDNDKIQTTSIVTVEDEGKLPQTTVTVEETTITEETEITKKPMEFLIEELPEVTEIIEVVSDDGKPKKRTKKTRKIVKEKDGLVQETEIVTIQDDKETPQTTVTIQEISLTELAEEAVPVEEIPEVLEVTEVIADDGKPKKRVRKVRKIVKEDENKVQTTEIVTVEDEGSAPQTTVAVEETDIKTTKKKKRVPKPKEVVVEELPEVIEVTEIIAEDGTPKKRTKKTRKIIKKDEGALHTTEIVTIQEDKGKPEVTVVNKDIPLPQTVEEAKPVEEISETVEVTEVISKDEKPKKRIKKVRKIIKEEDGKVQTTAIVTVEDEGEAPQTIVTVQETEITEETIKKKKPKKPKDEIIQELPEVIEITDIITEDGKPKKRTKKIRKIVKEKDGVIEATEIISTQDDKEEPITTVTIEEVALPKTVAGAVLVHEIPEIIEVTEITDEKGKPKKRVKKVRKLVKKDDDKMHTTEIITIEDEGKAPETTVVVEEISEKEKLVTKPKETVIEELPEIVEISELTSEDGKLKKRTKKTRQIVKKEEGVLHTTEIVTVQDDKEQPSVTVIEQKIILPKTIKQAVPIEETPEVIEVTEVIDKEGKPRKRVKKVKKLIKEKDNKIHTTAIVTVEDEGEAPQTTVEIEEIEATEEIIKKKPKEYVAEELPEVTEISDVVTKDGKSKKRIKKTRKIVKEKDGVVQETKIVTVQDDKEEPQTTITIQEVSLPKTVEEGVSIEEIPELVEVIEFSNDEGKPKKRVKKLRKFIKKDDDKIHTTEILTVEDEGQLPQTIVNVEELPLTKKPAKKEKKITRPKDDFKPRHFDGDTPVTDEVENDKLKPGKAMIMKVERKDVSPQKLNITDIKKEPINLTNIKLRKPKVTQKKTPKSMQLPKFLLKSIIKHIKFPPETESEKIPIITQMKPVVRDCGVLSRNIREAEEVLKTKKRKLKVPKEIPDELEKLDLELEELKKAEKEVVDENYKYQRKPKDISKEEEQEPPQIKLGKGKIPETPESLEQVHLKKIPEKPQDTIEGKDKKPQEDEPSPRKLRKKPSEESTELEPFQPYDIERDDVDKEELEKLDIEVDDKKKPKDKDTRKTKPKPKTPKQDTEQIILEKNKPKPTEEDEENEIKLRIPKSDKPEELPEKIKLKPFIKEKDATDQDTKPDTTLVLPKPIPTTEPDEDIDEISDADRKTSKRIVKLKRKKPKDTKTEEVPEKTEVINIVSEDGKPKKRIKKTRKILKEEDGVLQTTEIVTIQDENEQPETTVSTKEVVLPGIFEKSVPVEEIPETTEVSEVVEEDGKRKKRIKKVRKIIKEDDDKLQTTSIVTIEEEGKAPETTVTVEETEITDEVKKTRRSRKFDKPLVEELPEITEVTEIIAEEGKPKKRTKKTRKIVKEDEGVVQTTEIVTVQDEQEQPQTTVTVQEIVLPKPDEERIEVEEVPEVTEVSEITSEDGKSKKRIRKIRKIVKKQDDKVQTTSIVTEEEEGKIPTTTVTVEETEVTETMKKKMKRKPKEKEPIKELYVPSLEEIKDESDVLDAVKLVILKKLTGLPDVPPVSEENLQIEEAPEFKPKKKAKPKQTAKISQELPEVVEVIEIISEDGKPKKRTKKIRKIVKEEDGVLHKTEIVTIQDDKSEPNVTVTEQEITLPQTVAEAVPVEESPEVVQVTEVIAEDGKAKKRVKKVRKIIKKDNDKIQTTSIVTVEDEGNYLKQLSL